MTQKKPLMALDRRGRRIINVEAAPIPSTLAHVTHSRVVLNGTPSTLICNASSKLPYDGAELLKPAARPGADDHKAFKSRGF